MKKNNNESSKNGIIKNTEGKENAEHKIIPSKKAENNNDERNMLFKKVLYGYSPDEVEAFINEINETHEASLKLLETKISSMKEELILSNRERDCYIEKCREYKTVNNTESISCEDKTAEYEAEIFSLSKKINELKAENAALKNNSVQDEVRLTEKYAEKISETEYLNAELKKSLSDAQKEISSLLNQLHESEALNEEYKSVLMQLEEIKKLLAKTENDLKEKADELKEKSEKIDELNISEAELKKRISELEIQNTMLTRRATESEAEISKLKEINKALVLENAEKINTIENEYAKNRLAVQKELKLYSYYVDRAELTVSELTKQIDQIKQSIQKQEL